jgi:hypothetical protein
VFNFEQTNPIQPLNLRFSYLFIFAIKLSGLRPAELFVCLTPPPASPGAILPSEQINANGLGLP